MGMTPTGSNYVQGMYNYGVGVNNVGSYQVAGIPYITGSSTLAKGQEVKYDFPMVTKTITIINGDTQDIRVHFNSTGSEGGEVISGRHFLLLDSKEDSYTFNVKAKEIYITALAGNSGNATFTVIAELTQINVARMYELTGSGLTTGDGT